ncbi:flagellar motor switch phosphatase FliY [Clostridium thermarum]|uniref:flagellar motor switch phosphatase FliY n=1 Tax=Clostridium thermarum TaxID=1716543 RepID=UPI00111E8EA5|nr:flagellar motor switch phosphatase FliY [Clostridium thermarum]
MSNGFLSQEEIDSLLNGGGAFSAAEEEKEEILTDLEKDLLGEVGNISMGSASTALSQIINQQVNITTPVVTVTTLEKMKTEFEVPNIALEVKYVSGISGKNVLILKITDAAVIANLMMGGDGKVSTTQLSEIEESAVSEAMNQMIGSAATSMATMFAREVNISPPVANIWFEDGNMMVEDIDPNEHIVKVSFRLTIGDLVDSRIMQVLPVETAKKIVSIMMGEETSQPAASAPAPSQSAHQSMPVQHTAPMQQSMPMQPNNSFMYQEYNNPDYNSYGFQEKPIEKAPPVEVQKAQFQPLQQQPIQSQPKNIDLILDVPLEISVVLGRTKKSIRDILALGTGSLIELDKLAEEPVEILVNGKRVAYGEVVVVDENFGVRITSIVSNSERIQSLGK